ncbi:MAG TPA: GntR family transcriptional regulator [Devosiaceae bacterium]
MARTPNPLAATGGAMGYSPLYLQVKQQLVEKMIAGDWPPGALLPSEQQLGLQMGVSQGTVRKALDALANENIVVRHQGRGTFVAEHDQQRTLFQFFKLVDADGERRFPETVFSRLDLVAANPEEREAFGLGKNARIWHIHRHRALKGKVTLTERVSLVAERFPRLDSHVPLPNNIYQLYERDYGTTIARAVENLRAVSAGREEAEVLGCAVGDPLLQIDRRAFALDGSLAELRQTNCLTNGFTYLSDLS